METREFHLCRESWICVMEKNYQIEKVSLMDALLNAGQYRGLAGETELQNVAILRLLLAVLHTIFYRQNEEGDFVPMDSPKEARRRWKAIWDAGRFPEKPIREYFAKWEDRFWLFDEEHPFYQVPGIEGTNNPAKKMNGVLVESNNKIQLFSMRGGKEKENLSYDEATRWLVYLQSFDDNAAKNPSPKLCHVANLGIVFVKGETLFETLMLNLTFLKDGMEPWGEAKPLWEREKPSTEKLKEMPIPDNQPELFTLASRRVLLHREEGLVNSYVEAAGEFIQEESAFCEQMTFWRVRETSKEMKEFVPKPHDKTRQMWRDFSSLLGNSGKVPKPGVISWVTMLQNKKILPKGSLLIFETVGVEYGNRCCGVVDDFSDSLELHANLLDDMGKTWQRHISDEIERCDKLAEAVGILGWSLGRATGSDGIVHGKKAKEQAYYRFDVPFRQWLLQIDPEQELEWQDAHRKAWRDTAGQIVRNLGQELVEQAGSTAVVGRVVIDKKDKEGRHYNTAEAFNIFLHRINQINR